MAQPIEMFVQVRAPRGVGIRLPLNLWSTIRVPAPAGTVNVYLSRRTPFAAHQRQPNGIGLR
jgi:hypothetical protein